MSLSFRKDLEDHILEKVTEWVGVGTHPTKYVKTFDNHLHDFDLDVNPEPWPFMVVSVRSTTFQETTAVGTTNEVRAWSVHIYYIAIENNYNEGALKRDEIMSRLHEELQHNRDFGRFSSNEEAGHNEYVWNSEVTDVLFDSSGQEEYYSFVSELYLTVYTEKI